MHIDRVLNNNVIIVRDEKGTEKILMGRGLAFNKRVGNNYDSRKVEKEFVLLDSSVSQKFQGLVADIPFDYFKIGEEIIKYGQFKLGKELNDAIYIAIVDHIYTAAERQTQGVKIVNRLLWETKKYYPEEFKIGKYALQLIKKEFSLELPEDEAGFIALHFIDAQVDVKMHEINDLTTIVHEITNIVKYHFNIYYDEESVYYYRFITHLKFLTQRLILNEENEGEVDNELLEIVKIKYAEASNCTNKVNDFMKKKYNYSLSKDEWLYLTIHIEKVVSKKINKA